MDFIGNGGADPAGCKSLYVGNLHPYVNEAMLQEIFSTLGPVLEVKVIKDKVTGLSAGYGFVKFLDHRVADLALQTINGRVLYGQVRQLAAVPTTRVRSRYQQQQQLSGQLLYDVFPETHGRRCLSHSALRAATCQVSRPVIRGGVKYSHSAGGESELGVPKGSAGGHHSALPHIRRRPQQRGHGPYAPGRLPELWRLL